jgi:iron-sulfur cluster assembly accessory protein
VLLHGNDMTIHLTPAAVDEIRRMQRRQPHPDSLFRLGVEVGGCEGMYYTLALIQAIQPGDICYKSQGISILVDEKSAPYLEGLQLDYAEDLMGGGFRFDNPNVSQTCSCGLSFATKF